MWQGRDGSRRGSRSRKPSRHITSIVRKQRIGGGAIYIRPITIFTGEALRSHGSTAFWTGDQLFTHMSLLETFHIQNTVPSLFYVLLIPQVTLEILQLGVYM